MPRRVMAASLCLCLAACSGDDAPAPTCASARGALGCEFWPTVTANAVDDGFAFGIALVNPGGAAAVVWVEGGALDAPLELEVAGGSTELRTLPWVGALKACTSSGQESCGGAAGASIMAAAGAYHVTSDHPIVVVTWWSCSPRAAT